MPTLAEIDAEIARRGQSPDLQAIEAEIARRQSPQPLDINQQGDILQPQQPTVMQEFVSDTAGKAESAMAIGSGLVSPIIAGATATPFAFGDSMEAAEGVRQGVQDRLTYQPKTNAGKQYIDIGKKLLQQIGKYEPLQVINENIINPALDAYGALGDYVNETYGPAAATAVTVAPVALVEFLSLGSLSKLRSGTRLINDNGTPTKALEKSLDKDGLMFENLTPEAKAIIPEFATPKMLPSPKSEVAKQSESVLKKQIESGGRGDALSPLMLENGKIISDRLGIEAERQGFHPGTIQMVKTSNDSTKKSMDKMLTMMQRIQKDDSLKGRLRPYDVVGDAFSKRLNVIRTKALDARNKLDNIAETQLPGKSIDARPVLNKLGESLEKLKIKSVVENKKGQLRPDYEGSMISKDRTSQKVINDLLDLLKEGGVPDAARLHDLKRQLDTMIDFRKKSKGGLTDAGKNVLKDIRFSINDTLRKAFPEYGEVNDILHKSLTAFDDFKDATKIKIDIFGENGGAAIGQESRKLLTNYQSRLSLAEAFDKVDDLANEFGGKFTDNYHDLAMFANRLDEKFGSAAPGSLQGIMQSTASKSQIPDIKAEAIQYGIGKGVEGLEKLRGINDFNAYRSMKDLLNR